VRAKLAGALIFTALISVVLVAIVGVRLIHQVEQQVVLDGLRRQAVSVGGEYAFVGNQPKAALRLIRRALNLSQAALYQIGADGNLVLVGGDENLVLTDGDRRALASGRVVQGVRATPLGDMAFVAQPITRPARTLALVLARPAAATDSLPIGSRILTAAALAVAVSVLISLYLSNRFTGPMRELAGAASDLAQGNFGRRVKVDSHDEIAVVGQSFNQMAEQLGDNDRRQREFFLSISHELRTPLTAIQGYAEAIEDGTTGPEGQTKAAGVIVSESRRLTRLVSDLLDLARIDARRFTISYQPVEVSSLLDQVQDGFARKAKDLGIEIDTHAEAQTVKADRDRLVQVLSNLVENALRYTPAGGRISLSSGTVDGSVLISVTDTGPGFDASDLDKAFDRQYLWQKYRGVRDVGTGLGLAITRELTERMGGRVTASNSPGGGARFTLELPPA
jgi:signal transduction histidine kinase